MRRALCCLERSGETEREREASEEDDSSMDDWAESSASAAARRWAGEHSLTNRGSSYWAEAGGGETEGQEVGGVRFR